MTEANKKKNKQSEPWDFKLFPGAHCSASCSVIIYIRGNYLYNSNDKRTWTTLWLKVIFKGGKTCFKKNFYQWREETKNQKKNKIGLRSELNITHATEIVGVSFCVALGGPGSKALQVSYYPDIASILMQW